MRVRKNPKAKQTLTETPNVLSSTKIQEQKWSQLFSNPAQPLYVELGTGKGQFLSVATLKHPDINWIGVERVPEVLFQALKKSVQTAVQNCLYFWVDIDELEQCFAIDQVDRFYLHFSDPWPKTRHERRRLTHRNFLDKYSKILSENGDIIVKTDSKSLYTFTIQELEATGWQIQQQEEDLHHSSLAQINIQTEYEEKFAARGNPIYYIQATPR